MVNLSNHDLYLYFYMYGIAEAFIIHSEAMASLYLTCVRINIYSAPSEPSSVGGGDISDTTDEPGGPACS